MIKLRFDNVDFNSRSGPNGFGLKLAKSLLNSGQFLIDNQAPNVQLSFIESKNKFNPTILRLDGIYFNNKQDWKLQNNGIKKSYDSCEHIVFQSNFNRDLVTKFFGFRENTSVIRNGTDLKSIKKIEKAKIKGLEDKEVWLSASSWRPHKRLKENIEYFLHHAPEQCHMLVAGPNPDFNFSAIDRVHYLGNLHWEQLISVMKTASTFVHLAYLDHCPNVVVDARASDCHIVCSSSGGTHEIAGSKSTIIKEFEWDMEPIDLYNPPKMDFSQKLNLKINSEIDIELVSKEYANVIERVLS